MTEMKENEIVVIASTPEEMVTSQHALIASVAAKIEAQKLELAESQQILEATITAKVNQTAAKRLIKQAEHRLLYLTKVHAALEAGYVMVPDMPGQVIAIRTTSKHAVTQGTQRDVKSWTEPSGETPAALPVGDGVYVDPVPEASMRENTNYKGEVTSRDLVMQEFSEELAMPVQFLKPTVIKRTGEAIELKVFDEIVAVYDGAKEYRSRNVKTTKGDPLIIGRIFDVGAGRQKYQRRKTMAFLIAWFVDTAAI
jgi:hypothetical protein